MSSINPGGSGNGNSITPTVPGFNDVESWAVFPAIGNVDFNGFRIENAVAVDVSFSGLNETLEGTTTLTAGHKFGGDIDGINDLNISGDTTLKGLLTGLRQAYVSGWASSIHMGSSPGAWLLEGAEANPAFEPAIGIYSSENESQRQIYIWAGDKSGNQQAPNWNVATMVLGSSIGIEINEDVLAYGDLSVNGVLRGNLSSSGIDMNTNRIIGCGNPTAPQDVATKAYVDTAGVATPNIEAVLTVGGDASGLAIQNLGGLEVGDILVDEDLILNPTTTGTFLIGDEIFYQDITYQHSWDGEGSSQQVYNMYGYGFEVFNVDRSFTTDFDIARLPANPTNGTKIRVAVVQTTNENGGNGFLQILRSGGTVIGTIGQDQYADFIYAEPTESTWGGTSWWWFTKYTNEGTTTSRFFHNP